jgi:hypothetical protein
MASGHNIQDIPVPSAWGNYFRYHISRTKEVTLSDWQHAFDRVRCCIKFNWAANSNNDMIRIMPSDIARISFNFGGGTEIPYLCLRMSLPKAPNDPNPVVMMVFWTAWSERGFDQTRSPSPLGEDPPAGRYSFSSRLYNVSFETKDLPSNVAEQTGWAVKPTYFIGWKSEESPYCIGFNASLQGLSAQQTFIAQQFRLLRNTNLDVNILTASLGTLMLGWQQLASMPSPTIPPYARYNSRFNRTLNRLEFIRDVDEIRVDGNVRSQHLLRQKGWTQNPPMFAYPDKISSKPAKLHFISEREYEAIKVVGLLREAHHARNSQQTSFNRVYQFNLTPAVPVNPGPMTGQVYNIFLNIRPNSTGNDLETQPPNSGDPVTITFPSQTGKANDPWHGNIIPREDENDVYDICIFVRRPLGSQGTILNNLSATFRFGMANPPYAQARASIGYAMYGNRDLGIPRNTWVKKLLLAHDNDSARLQAPGTLLHANVVNAESAIHGMNTNQRNAFINCMTVGSTLRSKVTIIQGPPGTGKTVISAGVINVCLRTGIPVLAIAGSNYALRNLADRVQKIVIAGTGNMSGIYQLKTEYLESFSQQLVRDDIPDENEDPAAPQLLPPLASFRQDVAELLEAQDVDAESYQKVLRWVRRQLDTYEELSLGRRILVRIDLAIRAGGVSTNSTQEEEEFQLLWKFVKYHRMMEKYGIAFIESAGDDSALTAKAAEEEEDESEELKDDLVEMIRSSFNSTWRQVQKFYLYHARAILCTASTAGRPALRAYPAQFIIVEEAAQVGESDTLNGIIRFYPTLRKLIFCGDHKQLPCTVISQGTNEYALQESMSLMERLIRTTFPYFFLNMQYRSHPDIAGFISSQFYENNLQSHASLANRPESDLFREFVRTQTGGRLKPGNSVFVSVDNAQVWQRTGSTSFLNPVYIQTIGDWAQGLVNAGYSQDQILVVEYYQLELKATKEYLRTLGLAEIKVTTADASQGTEMDIVIVSTTRIGGNSGLGFVADPRRENVALGRARHGLIIVGHNKMGSGPVSVGVKAWDACVKYHQDAGRMFGCTGQAHKFNKACNFPREGFVKLS